MSEISIRIREITKKIGDIKVVESELLRADNNLNSVNTQISNTLTKLEKLHVEIENLQGFSITGLIKSAFIDKKATLELKRNEYYKLSKNYDQLKSEKSAIEYEVGILNRKIDELNVLNNELDSLMIKRENELLDDSGDKGLALKNVLSDIKEEKLFQNKCNNLLEISDNILQNLTLLSASLRDIESSLNWNRHRHRRSFSNKAMIVGRAKDYLRNVQILVNNYVSDLRSIGIHMNDLVMPSIRFENDFGMFFDNILSDFVLKRDLANGIENTESLFQSIKRVRNEILGKISSSENKIDSLMTVKENIIME
ncbi:MAG: hypothetical protein R2771_04485 [Saprospiraceae bacterium]